VQQIGGAIGLALLGTISTTAINNKFTELAPGLQKAAEAGQSPDQIKQLQGQFTAVATTHGFTTAFLASAIMFVGVAVVILFGLSVKYKDLANDGQPVHVG
jgi:NADH:ubiquinone oxidoreductase subunit 3 (subunit A)